MYDDDPVASEAAAIFGPHRRPLAPLGTEGNPKMPVVDIATIYGLTMKQAAFVNAYLDGPTRYNASRTAALVGYSPLHPRQSGHQVMKAWRVRKAVGDLFTIYEARESGSLV